ncbi:PucR family transcriptional regulator [Ornithinibacillus californiensis]|uniref:PucR family transcriptional regulator n=1 Tax=Ornithinibacillus californiensis TaxID=161536 RepID=UPI00064D732D|nr:PucR family transcriptional regulator [Ornithinibacillus californiensis]
MFKVEYRVKDLLKKDILKDATYLGDSSGLNNIITGITVVDSPDIADWLKGGELLLTSLYPIRGLTIEAINEWMARLSGKKVSALIIKIQKVFSEVPSFIMKASEQHGIPIIQISKDVAFIDIMYPVMEELFNDKVRKLEYYKEVHDRFTALSLADEGEDKIIETLEALIGNPVALYDRDFRCFATTNNSISLFYGMERINRKEEITDTKFPFYRQSVVFPGIQEQKSEQIVVTVETINHIKMYLIISELNKKITSFDFIAIENAATSLSLGLVKKFAIAEVEQKFKDDLLDDLLAGKTQSLHPLRDRANVIDFNLDSQYVALLFHLEGDYHGDEDGEKLTSHKQQQRHNKYLRQTIEFYQRDAIIRERSDVIIVLWKVLQKDENDRDWLNQIKTSLDHIQQKFKKYNENLAVQVGIGNIAQNALDLSQTYQEAQDSLKLGQLYNQGDFAISFNELGVYRLLYQLKDVSVLTNFVPQSLQKLLDYDHAVRNDLLETLKVFLQTSQNASKTAQALFVHYKTVTYRIERIKEITGIDFDDSEEILSVQLGFKILDVMNKQEKS